MALVSTRYADPDFGIEGCVIRHYLLIREIDGSFYPVDTYWLLGFTNNGELPRLGSILEHPLIVDFAELWSDIADWVYAWEKELQALKEASASHEKS